MICSCDVCGAHAWREISPASFTDDERGLVDEVVAGVREVFGDQAEVKVYRCFVCESLGFAVEGWSDFGW